MNITIIPEGIVHHLKEYLLAAQVETPIWEIQAILPDLLQCTVINLPGQVAILLEIVVLTQIDHHILAVAILWIDHLVLTLHLVEVVIQLAVAVDLYHQEEVDLLAQAQEDPQVLQEVADSNDQVELVVEFFNITSWNFFLHFW